MHLPHAALHNELAQQGGHCCRQCGQCGWALLYGWDGGWDGMAITSRAKLNLTKISSKLNIWDMSRVELRKMSTFAFLLFLVSQLSISLVDGMVSVCLSACLSTHPHTPFFVLHLSFIICLISAFFLCKRVYGVCVCVCACKVYLFWLFGCVAFDHSCCVRSNLPPHHLTTSLPLSPLHTLAQTPGCCLCLPFSFSFPPLFPRLPALHSNHPNILNILNAII